MKRIALILLVLCLFSVPRAEGFCVTKPNCLAPFMSTSSEEESSPVKTSRLEDIGNRWRQMLVSLQKRFFPRKASRTVVIGMGRWGRKLFSALSGQPFAGKVGAMARSNYDELAASGDYAPDSLYRLDEENLEAVLSDPEVGAVVIATPFPTHYEFARRALEAGKDVFVEKPVGNSADEVEDLMRIAKENNRILAVGYEYIYDRNIALLGRAVKDIGGLIFEVTINMLNPAMQEKHDGTMDVIEDIGGHALSMLPVILWPASVSSVNGKVDGESAQINLKYSRSIPVYINLSRDSAERNRTIIVRGSELIVELDYGSGVFKVSDTDGNRVDEDDERYPSVLRNRPTDVPFTLDLEFGDFLAACLTRRPPLNSIENVAWISMVRSRFRRILDAPPGSVPELAISAGPEQYYENFSPPVLKSVRFKNGTRFVFDFGHISEADALVRELENMGIKVWSSAPDEIILIADGPERDFSGLLLKLQEKGFYVFRNRHGNLANRGLKIAPETECLEIYVPADVKNMKRTWGPFWRILSTDILPGWETEAAA